MKILFVCDSQKTSNPYVDTLSEGLRNLGISNEISCKKLWLNNDFDIIHFQWPEAIFSWKKNIQQKDYDLLDSKLRLIKKSGKKIFITCHNLKPHVSNAESTLPLYKLIYQYTDYFVHMGHVSEQILKAQYPNAKHIIIPHHIYDNRYSTSASISTNKRKKILCFGQFRSDDERNFILKLRKKLKRENIEFILPGFFIERLISKNPVKFISRLLHLIKYKIAGIHFTSGRVSDEKMEELFSTSDVVLIQRLSILNSGNVPMGFMFGKVVVGINQGNVGAILKETGNPTFDIDDMNSVVNAIKTGLTLAQDGKGISNREYAFKNWNTARISKMLKCAYIGAMRE